MMRHSFRGIIFAALAVTACTNAGESLKVPTLPLGAVQVVVYFDRDGSHTPTTLDTVVVGARVALVVPGGNDTIRSGFTDFQGSVVFDTLPVGQYRVVVDRHALNDSVGIVAGDTGLMRITNDTLRLGRLLRFGYPEVNIATERAMAPGHRVLMRAVVTSPLQLFRDSAAFIVDNSGALRSTGSRPRLGNGNNIGDSVIVIGTTGQSLGQSVLVNGLFVGSFAVGLAPLPRITSVVDAINAKGGTLDAVLIQLSNIVIRDTAISGPDFALKVADPADTSVKITVILDQLLAAPHGLFFPGRTGSIKGVLVPVGDGTWVLKPRSGFDVVLN